MAAAQYNIIIEEGNAFYVDFTWLDQFDQPRDLTDAIAIFYFKEERSDEQCFVKAEPAGNGAVTIIDQVTDPGMIKVGIHASWLTPIPFDYGYYQLDLVFEQAFDNPIRLAQGRVTVEKKGSCPDEE